MQAAENGDSNDAADALDCALKWRILSKRQMRASPIVIVE